VLLLAMLTVAITAGEAKPSKNMTGACRSGQASSAGLRLLCCAASAAGTPGASIMA
jgi:hypothetical protein